LQVRCHFVCFVYSVDVRHSSSGWFKALYVVSLVVVYRVDVTTGLESPSDSSIRIFIQLFGANGDSGRRLLHQSSNSSASCFLAGQTDSFALETVWLGDLAKLVISHTSIAPGQLNSEYFCCVEIITSNILCFTFISLSHLYCLSLALPYFCSSNGLLTSRVHSIVAS